MKSRKVECSALWKELFSKGLQDDGWPWDWTTLGTLKDPTKKIRAKVVAKAEGVWAANGLIEAINEHPEARSGNVRLVVQSQVEDGAALKKGVTVCAWEGPAGVLLAFERPFLNLASYVSGIATRTRRLVEVVEKACPKNTPRITSTRKTLPGYRDLGIYGVMAGGGYAHRVSLSGGILIKENHIASAGGIAQAVKGAQSVAPHGLKVEIEVRSEKELLEALEVQADIVMLDNFSPEAVQSALRTVAGTSKRPVVEVSGGLNESNIARYAIPGVDILSVGSLTHSVQAVDLSLLVE